ncbi:MAG: MerR family DNA-binding transcriptional regulator [Vicinamibacterales bacterium]
MPDDERLLTDRDVAQHYGVSERTVRHWRAKGQLPTVRTPSGQPRTPASALTEHSDEPTRPPR